MRTIPLLLGLLLLVLSVQKEPVAPSPSKSMPFIGVDLSKLRAEDRQVLQEASEDFQAVVSGKKPVHAVIDEDAPLPADGGTTYYKGRRYELTILMSLSSFGGFEGSAYGPILEFDRQFAPGNTSRVSDIRVYSSGELRKLLGPGADD